MKLATKAPEAGGHLVCTDSTKTSINGEPTQAWFRRSSRCRVLLSGLRDWACLLGVVTDDGRSFFSRFPESVTAKHAKYFILEVYQEFDDDLLRVLDGASYLPALAATVLANRDDVGFVQLPAYLPVLNTVEECWRQLEAALGNRYFESIEERTTPIDSALNQ